jgi:hypothetical protein
LLQARSFDLVYLLSTPNTERNTAATVAALKGRQPVPGDQRGETRAVECVISSARQKIIVRYSVI